MTPLDKVNADTRSILSRWLSGPVPQHALLIEGPWGSGKTHLIKGILKQQGDSAALYVSLYGVGNLEDFEKSIVRARWPILEGRIATIGRQTKSFLSRSQVLSTRFDFNAFTATEFAMADLPQIIVFDDLERAEMPMRTLMGAINRLVEHDGKHVVILANEAAIARGGDSEDKVYKAEKEKLIGRTLRIKPDIEAALMSIWGDVAPSSLSFLKGASDDIREVFELSRTDNLRLLRQVLIGFSECYAILPDEATDHTHGMRAFLRCYLALSFDYLSGRLSLEDLQGRADTKRFGWGTRKEGEEPPPLGKSFDRYSKIGVHAESSAISVEAGVALIGRAQLPDWLADDIMAASAFKGEAELGDLAVPEWITLWQWRTTPLRELEQTLQDTHERLKAHEITEPGVIIHIYSAYKGLERVGIVPDNIEPQTWFATLTKDLAKAGKIPPREPGKGRSGSGYGYSIEMGTFRFGGYAFELDEDARAIINLMKAEQDAALQSALPDYTEMFCALLRDNPEDVLGRFNGERRGDFWWNRSAILNFTDPEKVARTLTCLWANQPELCQQLIEAMGNRLAHGNSMRDEELPWVKKVRPILSDMAKSASPLLGAQVEWALDRYWDHLLETEEEG